MKVSFEWDDQKAKINIAKHGISFTEAATVFGNPQAVMFYDEAHSNHEDREFIVGHSIDGLLLIVSFTERSEGVIRIISAREATKRERRDYEETPQV